VQHNNPLRSYVDLPLVTTSINSRKCCSMVDVTMWRDSSVVAAALSNSVYKIVWVYQCTGLRSARASTAVRLCLVGQSLSDLQSGSEEQFSSIAARPSYNGAHYVGFKT